MNSGNVIVNAKVPRELRAELRAAAARQDRSMSSLVRLGIRTVLDEHRKQLAAT